MSLSWLVMAWPCKADPLASSGPQTDRIFIMCTCSVWLSLLEGFKGQRDLESWQWLLWSGRGINVIKLEWRGYVRIWYVPSAQQTSSEGTAECGLSEEMKRMLPVCSTKSPWVAVRTLTEDTRGTVPGIEEATTFLEPTVLPPPLQSWQLCGPFQGLPFCLHLEAGSVERFGTLFREGFVHLCWNISWSSGLCVKEKIRCKSVVCFWVEIGLCVGRLEMLQLEIQRMEGLGATAIFCREEMGLFRASLQQEDEDPPVHPAFLGWRFGSKLAELHLSGKSYTFSWVWNPFPESSRAKFC